MLRKISLMILSGIYLLGLLWGNTVEATVVNSPGTTMKEQLFNGKKSAFGNVMAPEDFDWRQCEGITLDFILENNINANILSKECAKFTEATGINIRIKSVDFETMIEQINMEFISQVGGIELIYVDPYQTLVRFKDCLEDLNKYENDPELPHIVGGLESFKEDQVKVCSYFEDEEKLCTIPFDSTTMILFYRKDIFEKYMDQMQQDLGYCPMPGTREFTWERYMEVAEWMEENVPEIEYPFVTMSDNHNSIYAEFSNILDAYGGDYFADVQISSLGIEYGKELQVNEEEFLKALDVYQRLTALGGEEQTRMDWDECADLFREGKVAMMVNWDENAPMMENEKNSKVAGITGYAVLPYGSEKSGNVYGGSGIGINKFIDEDKKLAAWMFIVWCTSPQVQIQTFLEEEGGNMPTRTNLLHLIAGQYMAQLPQAPAVINAQKGPYVYFRPKMKYGYEFENIMRENLEKLVAGETSPEETADCIAGQWNLFLSKQD